MAIKCGWAAIDERGLASGGAAGDQKQRSVPDYYGEARVGNWYYFGQTEVFRWRDRNKAKKYAEAIKSLCNNKMVGYDQGGRASLFNQLKANGWDPAKITAPCETDCSALAGVGVNCVTKQQSVPAYVWTGNLRQLLMNTGLFTRYVESKFLTQDAYLMEGDIINNPSAHVIVALETGSKAVTPKTPKKAAATIAKEVVAGKWGVEPARSAKLKAAGYTPAEILTIQKEVNKLLGKATQHLTTARVIATSGLNVRNKPTVNGSKVLRTLPYTTKVTCYGTAKGPGASLWWRIAKDKNEYVSADWLK